MAPETKYDGARCESEGIAEDQKGKGKGGLMALDLEEEFPSKMDKKKKKKSLSKSTKKSSTSSTSVPRDAKKAKVEGEPEVHKGDGNEPGDKGGMSFRGRMLDTEEFVLGEEEPSADQTHTPAFCPPEIKLDEAEDSSKKPKPEPVVEFVYPTIDIFKDVPRHAALFTAYSADTDPAQLRFDFRRVCQQLRREAQFASREAMQVAETRQLVAGNADDDDG